MIWWPTATNAFFLPRLVTRLSYLRFKNPSFFLIAPHPHSTKADCRYSLPWMVLVLFFTATLVVAGAHARPTAQVVLAGKHAHVCTYFTDNANSTVFTYPASMVCNKAISTSYDPAAMSICASIFSMSFSLSSILCLSNFSIKR